MNNYDKIFIKTYITWTGVYRDRCGAGHDHDLHNVRPGNLDFCGDTKYSHTSNNARVAYKYSKWEDYGYLDYVTYSDWLNELVSSGELTEEERSAMWLVSEEPRHRILSRSVNMSKNSQSIISLRDTR